MQLMQAESTYLETCTMVVNQHAADRRRHSLQPNSWLPKMILIEAILMAKE